MKLSIPIIVAITSVVSAEKPEYTFFFKHCKGDQGQKLDIEAGRMIDVGSALGGSACSAMLTSVLSGTGINDVYCMTYTDAKNKDTSIFPSAEHAILGNPLHSNPFTGFLCSSH